MLSFSLEEIKAKELLVEKEFQVHLSKPEQGLASFFYVGSDKNDFILSIFVKATQFCCNMKMSQAAQK